jgi:hypothetical protein
MRREQMEAASGTGNADMGRQMRGAAAGRAVCRLNAIVNQTAEPPGTPVVLRLMIFSGLVRLGKDLEKRER